MVTVNITKRLFFWLLAAGLATVAGAAPAPPLGMRAHVDPYLGAVVLMWEPAGADVAGYNIYRQESLDQSPVKINPYAIEIPVFADQLEAHPFYYSVRAFDAHGQESMPSLTVFSSSQPKLIYASADGLSTVEMPMSMSAFFDAQQNEYGVELALRLVEQPLPADPQTLRALRLDVVRADTGEPFPGASFPLKGVKITLGYQIISGQFLRGAALVPGHSTDLSFYWNNGINWIKRGATPVAQNTIALVDANIGQYELRLTPAAALTLTKANVAPSLFTPNGDGLNDRVFFNLENPNNSSLNGRVYDLAGRFVAHLQVETQQVGSTTLVWAGTNDSGSVVPSGLYVYQIEGENKAIRGTVSVAH